MARRPPESAELIDFSENHPRPWRVSTHDDPSSFGAYVIYDANHKEVCIDMDFITAHFIINNINSIKD